MMGGGIDQRPGPAKLSPTGYGCALTVANRSAQDVRHAMAPDRDPSPVSLVRWARPPRGLPCRGPLAPIELEIFAAFPDLAATRRSDGGFCLARQWIGRA